MRIISLIILIFWTISVQSQNKITIKKTPQHVDTFAIEGDSLVISLSGDNKGKKKVFLSTGSGGSITYVPDIDSLRNYPGNTTKLVFVKGYWNGLQYGGGPFTWYATDITGRGDDRGISIKAPTGYWVRVDREFRATYFGMVDTSDLDIIEKYDNTWEAENLTNQVPDGEKIIFDPGYVFRTRGGFNWGYDNLKRIHVEGYGSTILRGSQIQDSVKSNSSTWVRVAHPERWDTFQYIALYDGTDRMLSPAKIWRINGDTLFAAIGSENYATGDCYSQSFQMLLLKPECTLRGITFDGNLDSNQIYNYWGTSGALYLSSNGAFVNRINIKNSPGEGVLCFEKNTTLDGFVTENCTGNGVHFGSNRNTKVINGVIKKVNNLARRSNIMTMGHEGGAIAHSDQVHQLMVANIQIDSALVAIADVNGHDDSLNHYDRIQAYNCVRAVEFDQVSGGQTLRDLRISNSRFYNCGVFAIRSNPTGPADSTEYIRDVAIDNVQLYNTTLSLDARNYNVTMSNIYYDDTSSTEISIQYCYHLKINGLVKNGGGRIYMAAVPGAVIENFEMRNCNGTSFLHLADAGAVVIRNGAFYQDNAASGFVGIYGPRGGEIRDCYMNLGGTPNYGILCAGGSGGGIGTTVVNSTFITPLGTPGIRSYGGSSGDLYVNNKVNNDISNASGNREYGTINITDDDLTFGNTSVIKILGKIKDSAGNLGTNGQVMVSDGSGFITWQTPSTGTGDIEGVTVTSPITGGGTSGTVNIAIQQANGSQSGYLSSTDWTTFNNKWTPSGTTAYVPFFSSSTALTSQHDFITYNSANAFKLGLGFTSGGNTQLDNYFTSSSAAGLAIQDPNIAGLGLSTSSSNRWSIFTNTSNELVFNRWGGASWPATPWLKLGSTGMLTGTDATFSGLSGSGTRMVVANASGVLSTQTIPSAGVSSVSGTGTIVASPTTGAVIITDNQSAAGAMFNPGAQTFTVSSTSPTLVNFTNSSANSPMLANATTDAITVPVTGRYVISYSATVRSDIVTGTGSPSNSFGIHVNGTLSANGTWAESQSPSGSYVNISKTVVLNLTANDVITLRHYSIAGTTYNTQILYAHMSCQRVW